MDTFPEYREERWNYPTGYNPGDQRHKTRIWLDYEVPIASTFGSAHVGFVQRATPASLSMPIAGATLEVTDGPDSGQRTTSDVNGRFVFSALKQAMVSGGPPRLITSR